MSRPKGEQRLCLVCREDYPKRYFMLNDRVTDVCKHCRGHGGKRPGAGGPKKATVPYQLYLRKESAARLRARIAPYKRSEFISDLIDANL